MVVEKCSTRCYGDFEIHFSDMGNLIDGDSSNFLVELKGNNILILLLILQFNSLRLVPHIFISMRHHEKTIIWVDCCYQFRQM